MFSPLMKDLLDLPPCLSTSIIIPDSDLKTLSLLIDLIKEGKSSQEVTSIESIQDLAASLGIDLRNVTVSNGSAGTRIQKTPISSVSGAVPSKNQRQPPILKPTSNPKKVIKVSKNKTTEPAILSNIKEERREETSEKTVSKFNCEICQKTFNSINPLAFHYCKHFFKDLQGLNFPDFVDGNNCTKCNRTFADRKAVLCHVGVKHKYINYVLTANGLSKLPLGQEVPTPAPASEVSIKKEQTGVTLSEASVRPSQKPRKQPVKLTNSAGKSRNTKEVKEIKVCQICDKEEENMSKLVNHMISSHLLTEIKQRYASLYNGKECLECKKTFSKTTVWQHLGAVHNKLDEVLVERGLRPIKAPPTPTLRQVFVKIEAEEEGEASEDQELQISNLFASYDAATLEVGDPIDTSVEMAADPLV